MEGDYQLAGKGGYDGVKNNPDSQGCDEIPVKDTLSGSWICNCASKKTYPRALQ